MSVNRVTLVGNPGGDPELRHLPSGQLVVGFSIATDEVFTDEQGQRHEHAEWHNVVAFGKLAETCGQYLKQGRQVYVEAVCGRGSSRRGTMAASVRAPRLSLRASQFLGAPPTERADAAAIEEPPIPPADEAPF